ncbi:MAG TPA: hypothetical protein VF787_09725 [Thermoanaerobaculia bacterium]
MRRSTAFAALRGSSLALTLLFAALVVPRLAASEIVLVPLWYAGGGAAGSYWTTHLSVYNTGDYVEPNDRFVLPCNWTIDPCPRGFWKHKMLVYEAQDSYPGGFVMRVDNPDNLSYSLRIFEQNARFDDLGVDIPVVRERDLKTGPIQLMDIPGSDPDVFRYLLRVYAVGNAPKAVVRLNGYLTMGDGSPDLIITRDLLLTPGNQGLGHYYAEDGNFIRDLIIATAGMGQLRVEVEPMTPNLRWWGLMSATNNETNDVTIVTPN